MRKVVQSFRFGTIGTGHTNGRNLGEQVDPSLATRGPSPGSERSGSAEPKTKSEPKKPILSHMPSSVSGPHGTRRRIVRGHSTGLQFAYEEMPGKSALWELDAVHGILSFNTRHPLWEQAERRDRVLMKFQEHIAIQALTMATMPDDWKTVCTEFVQEQMPAILFLLMNEPSVSGRRKKSLEKAA